MAIPGFTYGTDYHELNGSGRLGYESKALKGERLFRLVNYTRLADFLVALLGGYQNTSGTVSYNTPHRFSPSAAIWCVGVQSEPIGVPQGNGTTLDYSGGAHVTASYSTLSFDPKSSAYIQEERSTTGQSVTLAKSKNGVPQWQYGSDSSTLKEDGPEVVKIFPQGEYILTLPFAPKIPTSTINGLIGKINSGTFPSTSEAGGFAANTLLFLGDSASRKIEPSGAKAWNLTYRFSYNPNDWRKVFRPDTGLYDAIVTVTAGTSPYDSADFSPLLTLAF